jgi:ribosomal protein S18 acetylase RimI-like enzyme
MVILRSFEQSDWATIWQILKATFESGDTYTFSPGCTEAEIFRAWIEQPLATYVAATESGTLVGTYFLKPNQPGLGGHVCNCGYVVAAEARGRGIAAAMCEHSQAEAVKLGFRAMQFNLVVVTNTGAVRLWQKLGFQVVGTVPEAFLHSTQGYVGAHVMIKRLESSAERAA